jgi:hypothetical protein
MQFEPRTEQELREARNLPNGVYDCEVADAKEGPSKAGNDMITLSLRVFPNDGGSPRLLRDWLVCFQELKINRFCRAMGLEDAYNNGTLTAFSCIGAAGKCRVKTESSEEFGEQNKIADYIPAEVAEFQREQEPTPVPKKTKAAKKPKDVESEWEAVAAKTPDEDIPF